MSDHHHAHEHDHHDHHRNGHGSGHSHSHAGHAHAHGPANYSKAFAVGVALNLAFVIAEVIYGLASNSLALLSDAGHNLSDVFGLLLAWGASRLAVTLPTKRRTYGWRRASILAALVNAVVLLMAVGVIGWESIQRIMHPEPVIGTTIIWVAALGVVINAGSALLFMRGGDDINIRGAYLHLAADAAVSLGVVIAGLIIRQTGWLWLDPAVSFVVAVVITIGTWSLLSQSLNLSMDAVPANIDPHVVEDFLGTQPHVKEVHDLHIWAMSTTEVALTVHLIMQEMPDDDHFLHSLTTTFKERFGIHHATVQLEHGSAGLACDLQPTHVV